MNQIDEILKDRGARYGEFIEHARITQQIKAALASGIQWDKCNPAMKETLEMIAHKMGRIVNGDPYYDDSWVDIVGYAQLVVNELKHRENLHPGYIFSDRAIAKSGDTRELTPSEYRHQQAEQIRKS